MMSNRAGEDSRGVPQDVPEEYRRAEYDEYAAELPYGSGWPGAFRVGAGALMLFFGAMLVFLILLLVAPTGLEAPIVAVGLMILLFILFSLYMWSGVGRYIGSRRMPSHPGVQDPPRR